MINNFLTWYHYSISPEQRLLLDQLFAFGWGFIGAIGITVTLIIVTYN